MGQPLEDIADVEDKDGIVNGTLRYEPSWSSGEADVAPWVERALRERPCSVEEAEREWVHRRLARMGHDANSRGHHFAAHAWFECACCVRRGPTELLSATNMRLRFGQVTLAAMVYKRMLSTPELLSEAQRGVAERKLKEANEAREARQREGQLPLEDEFGQLVFVPDSTLHAADSRRLLPILRQQGHLCNGEEEYEGACYWYTTTSTQLLEYND